MANMRKLTLRQLSLNCDSPTIDQRRKNFKKQFSEDFCEVKEKLGVKTRDRPHPIRIAWADEHHIASPKEEGVIAKKCIKEVKKAPKLSRHGSLEKESILYSKQELAERLRQALKEREQEKPNLNIFLAHNTNTADEDIYETPEPEIIPKESPKITPQLLATSEGTIKNVFQIRKSKEISYAPSRPNALVVIPIVEKEPPQILEDASSPSSDRSFDKQDPKAIKNVIIRPATAAAKRERFQKRTNTAFNSVIKEGGARPPLVRSSSAPTKPEQAKPKFLATKRKIKSGKVRVPKTPTSEEDEDSVSNKENPKSKKEMNRYVAVNGTDIVTMVSLISPAASDTEEAEAELKPKSKTSPSKPGLGKTDEKDVGKNSVSLRKTVKSVSFQSSSIHAIRSFSASFPARRGSMATALILANGMKSQKNQEKRATNSAVPDDDERGPKRRLVRSATDKTQRSTEDDATSQIKEEVAESSDTKIKINIKEKTVEEEPSGDSTRKNAAADQSVDEQAKEKPEASDDGERKFGSAKEKECWGMYCKMADKGLKVSYDTILRGMLTPTEYRMRRRESVTPVIEEASPQ